MATQTPNSKLYKSDGTDTFASHITNNNSNMDKIDSSLKSLQDRTTATSMLNFLKTVDGSGSGLDADTLDGRDSAYFATKTEFDALSGSVNTNYDHLKFIAGLFDKRFQRIPYSGGSTVKPDDILDTWFPNRSGLSVLGYYCLYADGTMRLLIGMEYENGLYGTQLELRYNGLYTRNKNNSATWGDWKYLG